MVSHERCAAIRPLSLCALHLSLLAFVRNPLPLLCPRKLFSSSGGPGDQSLVIRIRVIELMPRRAGIISLDLLRFALGADSLKSARQILLELRGFLFRRPTFVAFDSNLALQPSRCAIGFVILWTFAC